MRKYNATAEENPGLIFLARRESMKSRLSFCRTEWLIRVMLLIIAVILGWSLLIPAIKDPVRTESGLLSGVPARDPSITVYKGVPFAAPPIGDLRWRQPQPPIPWQGMRKADQFGCGCSATRFLPPESSTSEDCLFLNVWTGAASAAEKRPVFVWFHGGRFIFGSGAQPLFDGEGLARKGLVVVTVNYRLGIFGFLATPELSKESGRNASGNWGLLDQIASLQWVRKNIAAFGGDPNRVTIAGQSAGGGSTLLLSSSPLAKGLFHRAISEAGARFPNDPDLRRLSISWRPLKDAESAGARYAEAHGAHSLKELRALSWDQLKDNNNANDEGVQGNPPPPLFRPAVDGWVIPFNYSRTYAKGLQNDVPFITGHEIGSPPQPVKLDTFQSNAKQKFGALADEFLKLYPASSDQEASLASKAASLDSMRISTFLWAEEWKRAAKNKVYTYVWTHAPPGPERATKGAYHESEINYVFNNLYATDKPWEDDDRKIADIMSSYWANFAATGDPNGKGLPAWPAFDAKSQQTMELGDKFGPIPLARGPVFDFFKRFFLTQDAW
jgi:para-nitrobenzyl esterase